MGLHIWARTQTRVNRLWGWINGAYKQESVRQYTMGLNIWSLQTGSST